MFILKEVINKHDFQSKGVSNFYAHEDIGRELFH